MSIMRQTGSLKYFQSFMINKRLRCISSKIKQGEKSKEFKIFYQSRTLSFAKFILKDMRTRIISNQNAFVLGVPQRVRRCRAST